MIEVPSAALTIDLLADEADFVSIGTNDLIQVHAWPSIAPTIACRACTSRCTRRSCACCARSRAGRGGAGLPVSVCGEMAADPALLPLLAGLGLREFSMTPAAIPAAQRVVRGLRIADTVRLASRALKAATSAEVEKVLAESLSPVKSS